MEWILTKRKEPMDSLRKLSIGLGFSMVLTLAACSESPAATAIAKAKVMAAAMSSSPISISITQPTYGFNVLPGGVRRIFATVTGGKTNAVNWSVTGGATLSATAGNWVDVTAPATGSICSINGTDSFTVSSARQFTL